jgi:endonuclease YncB( thermonuclease family)
MEASASLPTEVLSAPTLTPSEEPEPTGTATPTALPQATDTPEPTDTAQPSHTPRPSNTPKPKNSTTPTNEPVPTNTLVPTNTPAPSSTPIPPTDTATPEGPQPERGSVTNVVAGDTIEVSIDGQVYRVRYIGMDTPENGEPYFQEATNYNSQLVSGQTVMLVKDVSDTDPFDRLLRYVYLQDGTFVNAELVRQGFALVATYPPDVAHSRTFASLESEAQAAGRGLWSLPPTEPPPTLAPDEVCGCSGNLYQCSHFSTHNEAQACHDYCFAAVGFDIHSLDGNDDGQACESLP